MKSLKIFGVQIDSADKKTLLASIEQKGEPIWIVTANPEILLYAKDDAAYRDTLNRATYRLVDSFGLEKVCRLKGMNIKRLPGADLAFEFIKHASEYHQGVALIGGGDKKSSKPALKRLQAYFPSLRGIAEEGGMISKDGTGDAENDAARVRIAAINPSVLLVGFGHPKQERWIERYKQEFPSVKVFIGVGGTFDYWSGLISRAPKLMRRLGLEWLYRLISEPKRWKRIFNAVIIFPCKVLFG